MKKRIKKYGNSHVIVLNKEELEIYNLKGGDIIEITIKKVKGKIKR